VRRFKILPVIHTIIMSQEHREPDGSDKHRERVREIIDEDRELLDQLE